MFGKRKQTKRINFDDEKTKSIDNEETEEEPEEDTDFEESEEEAEPYKEKNTKERNVDFSERWSIETVPLQVERRIYDNKTKKSYDVLEALVYILNNME